MKRQSVISLIMLCVFLIMAVGTDDNSSDKQKIEEPEKTAAQIAEEEAACRNNLQCWGDKYIAAAGIRCDDYVERLAKYDYKWTDGFFETKFSRFSWKDKAKGHVTYVGDKIQFQNGFGALQNHIYACDFDPINNAVLDVRASPGRL